MLSTLTNEDSKESSVESAARELSSIQKQLDNRGAGSEVSKLTDTINEIRSKMEEGCCDELDAPEKCRLRIKHPGWSSVALDAVERRCYIGHDETAG